MVNLRTLRKTGGFFWLYFIFPLNANQIINNFSHMKMIPWKNGKWWIRINTWDKATDIMPSLWRPKKGINLFMDYCQKNNIEGIRKSDCIESFKALFAMNEREMLKIYNDKEIPLYLRKLIEWFVNAKDYEILEKMLERAIGKVANETEAKITVNTEMTPEQKKTIASLILNNEWWV